MARPADAFGAKLNQTEGSEHAIQHGRSEAKGLSRRLAFSIKCEFVVLSKRLFLKLSGSQVTPALLLQFHEPDDPGFYDLRL